MSLMNIFFFKRVYLFVYIYTQSDFFHPKSQTPTSLEANPPFEHLQNFHQPVEPLSALQHFLTIEIGTKFMADPQP